MLCLFLAAIALCLPPQKLRSNTLIWLCVLQDNLQRRGARGWREGVLSIIKYLKKLLQMLLTVICLNNEFSDYLLQLRILFYLVVQAYHKTLHSLNHSKPKIKFLNINWCKFAGYLISCGGGSSFNFHYHWSPKL